MTDTPRTIGRYRIQSVIGRGMMGVVYEALDPDLGRVVALKSVQLTFTASPVEQEAFDLRFLAEARAAAAIEHPAVVVVHDVGRDAQTGRPFIAFERLRGRTLDDAVADDGPLPWRTALSTASQLARALSAAHERGIVHRDIKPANIMLLADGQPKIMDFGIAKLPALELTSTGQFMGTPSYVSPEQLASEPLDGRSDLFSLGAVLHFMLTGRVAFDGGSIPATLALITFRDPEPPSSLVPGVPPIVDELVARTLAKQRDDRHADARALAEDLEDVLADRPPRHHGAWTRRAAGTLVSGAPKAPVSAASARPPSAPKATTRPAPMTPAAPPPAPAAAPSSAPAGERRRPRWLMAGLLAAVVLAIFALLGGRGLAPSSSSLGPLVVAPAVLDVDLTHTLRSGTLRVFVDDELALEEPLESYVSEDLVVVKLRKGRERASVKVKPGAHEVRVQVSGDGWSGSRSLSGQFTSGETRKLVVRVEGLPLGVGRELRASWGTS